MGNFNYESNAALVENEDKTRMFLEFLPEAVIVQEDEKIIYANLEVIRLLRINNEDEIKNKRFKDLIHPEYRFLIKNDQANINTELKLLINGRIIDVRIKDRTVYSDGINYCVTVINKVNRPKEEFEAKFFTPIVFNKREEVTLKDSEEFNKKLISLLPEGIVVQDGKKIVFANDAYAKILGYDSGEELTGKPLEDLVDISSIDRLKDRMEIIIRSSNVQPFIEYNLKRKNQQLAEVESSSIKVLFDGEEYILSNIRDITEKRKNEELKLKIEENKRLLEIAIEADKLKTEFFSNISHELRTPLNILLGCVQLLNMYFDDPQADKIDSMKKYIKTMYQNCYRLLRLINNILDITKIESGFYQLNLCKCNIVNLVEDIVQSVADYLINKDISIIFDTNVEEKFINCDPDKIERIMLNLLSNAIKFTNPGGEILVNIFDKGEYIIISVKDDGIGIPEEKLKLIFDRFVQADKSTHRNSEGTGIGLSLVYSLIKMQNGNIKVESELNKGTEFIIHLPTVNDKVICSEPTSYNEADYNERKIERMNIEFSDIYVD